MNKQMSHPKSKYQPPYTFTPAIVNLVAKISESIGRLTPLYDTAQTLRLRRKNRIRSIRGSLAIEGNTLSEEQITAILDGKRVIAPPREILEVRNALKAYEHFEKWRPRVEKDLLEAHRILMAGLIDPAGAYRRGGVGVMAGGKVIHMAPPADRVPILMQNLFQWLTTSEEHSLIASSVFHYEFEFIHPFADGNGRMGRLWQSLIIARIFHPFPTADSKTLALSASEADHDFDNLQVACSRESASYPRNHSAFQALATKTGEISGLTRWNPLFADVPVESLVYEHQAEYYQALQSATNQSNSSPFVEFMLRMILDALSSVTSTEQVSEQVNSLLKTMGNGERSGSDLMKSLKLSHRPTFLKNYLNPALKGGWIERTQPDSPRSPTQRYRLTHKGQSGSQHSKKS